MRRFPSSGRSDKRQPIGCRKAVEVLVHRLAKTDGHTHHGCVSMLRASVLTAGFTLPPQGTKPHRFVRPYPCDRRAPRAGGHAKPLPGVWRSVWRDQNHGHIVRWDGQIHLPI